MMHRIKNLLLPTSNTCRTFHELSALYRTYATSSASAAGGHGQGRKYTTAAQTESFMNGSSSAYIEDMFEAWQRDPNSVHKVFIRV